MLSSLNNFYFRLFLDHQNQCSFRMFKLSINKDSTPMCAGTHVTYDSQLLKQGPIKLLSVHDDPSGLFQNPSGKNADPSHEG